MALLNNLYIHCTSEDVKRGVTVTTHSVEKGLPITDNVKRKAITLSLSGKIVDVGSTKAKTILSNITKLHQEGKYVKFVGRNSMKNAIITSFDTTHDNSTAGGCDFTMELTEVRIANKAYVAKGNKVKGTSKQVTTGSRTKRYHTVKKGETLQSISKKYYGSTSYYKRIYEANKSKIKNIHKIQPGWKLLIP